LTAVAPAEVTLLGLERRDAGLDPEALEAWLREVVSTLCPATASLAVRFVDDGEMRRIHRRYRGRDHATDVLSFPGEDTPEGRHLGDLVVSLETARRQAADAGLGLDQEVRELVLHGVLHCLGHDHETDQGEMDRLELELRRRFLGDAPPGRPR
jgi:probable rRNA maturation factor